MKALIDAALHHTRTVLATLLLVLIAGLGSYMAIPKESAPDVNIPIIYVSMVHSGISPEDAERLLVRPMEKELRAVEGIKEMRSTAYEGGANVLLEFEAGFNADLAIQDVQRQVDKAKVELPDDTEEPTVNEVNISLFPVVVVTLSGNLPERTLLSMARHLEREIEGLPTVLEVDIGGDRDEQVDILIDPVLVKSYNLSANDFTAFLARNNKLVAAGALDTGQGRFSIKVPGLLQSVQDVLDLPIKVEGDAVVRLRDVADGRRGFADAESVARVNGASGLTLSVKKRIGTNIVDTVDAVKAVVARERQAWPEAVEIHYTQDQSKEIKTSLHDLQNSVIAAILLVMVVVVAALGVRSGLLVGLAIPGSFLMGILALAAMGLTVNMVVLFGLILAVGMLVDGAIVVTEYADRKMTEGLHRSQAYAMAAKRMAWPVIASTATTLAAFLPLAFWTGVVGEFMKYLPITLLATLSASLLMALIFVPTLGAVFGKPGGANADEMKALAASEHGSLSDLGGMTGLYARTLEVALRHAGKVLVAAIALLIAAQVLYGAFGRGIEFFPDVEPENANILVHARGNLSTQEKDALVREVEERILDLPEFKSVYTIVGKGAGEQDSPTDLIGRIGVEFTDWDTRRPASQVLAEVRERTADLAGIQVEVRKQESGPPVGKPVQVQLSSPRTELLEPAAREVRAVMDRLGGFTDVEDSAAVPGIEWELTVDRAQAAKFGVDVQAVGDMVQMVTRGLKVTDYLPDDAVDEIDIMARFPEANRTLDQLEHLFVNTAQGPVPVSAFVTRQPQPKTGEIRRTDGQRVVDVKADVAEGLLVNDKVLELQAALRAHPGIPAQVAIDFRGEDEEQRESQAFLVKAFGIALFIMAIILLTQFNSFYSALLILSAVIMSTTGVMLGLLVFNQPFGIIMSGVGVIALAGIVVNNNIVLIDTYDRLKTEFADPVEAIVRTGAQRLRPVMLTTVTTMLGLLPMVFSLNIDFVNREVTVGAPSMQWWSQLSIAIVSGLALATVLTLVVTPCMLKLRVDARRAWRARKARKAEA
ncbi:efflux RND transporter permease subunit [Novispirillum sp. DQ9]|uniref:efflux RND transporter permease subunit n=1 Tax=Novispirillum sp. DQ9 TaxID=3398612 RepID=UPI003C7A6A0E